VTISVLARAVATSLALVATFGACGSPPAPGDGAGPHAAGTARATTPTSDPWAVVPTQPVYHPTPVRLAEPDPVRLDVPAIGVSTVLDRLGLRPDGSMDVPEDFARAGWYEAGPRPGEDGPAVIAGHVDSRRGPAVFFRLHELRVGDAVSVARVDGSVATFTVRRVETYAKRDFPTEAVFGPTVGAELRLVTCGGEFDWSHHSYKSNVVAFATSNGY
jgi:LPXTG-site transpeptidase (sortase) family protein